MISSLITKQLLSIQLVIYFITELYYRMIIKHNPIENITEGWFTIELDKINLLRTWCMHNEKHYPKSKDLKMIHIWHTNAYTNNEFKINANLSINVHFSTTPM